MPAILVMVLVVDMVMSTTSTTRTIAEYTFTREYSTILQAIPAEQPPFVMRRDISSRVTSRNQTTIAIASAAAHFTGLQSTAWDTAQVFAEVTAMVLVAGEAVAVRCQFGSSYSKMRLTPV